MIRRDFAGPSHGGVEEEGEDDLETDEELVCGFSQGLGCWVGLGGRGRSCLSLIVDVIYCHTTPTCYAHTGIDKNQITPPR